MALRYGRSRLPELLANRKLTPAEFARRLGISGGYMSQIISGKRYFSLLAAYKAARMLGCTVEELYELIEE